MLILKFDNLLPYYFFKHKGAESQRLILNTENTKLTKHPFHLCFPCSYKKTLRLCVFAFIFYPFLICANLARSPMIRNTFYSPPFMGGARGWVCYGDGLQGGGSSSNTLLSPQVPLLAQSSSRSQIHLERGSRDSSERSPPPSLPVS